MKMIVDQKDGDVAIGRTSQDAPEIDNEVMVHNAGHYSIGEYYNVQITDAEEYDLFAEPIEKDIAAAVA